MGRPLRLTQPFDTAGPDGAPRTVGDVIVAALRAGAYIETAVAVVNVNPRQFREWLMVGNRARQARNTGTKTRELTRHQRACMRLLDQVNEALADAEHRWLASLGVLAAGGYELVTTIEHYTVSTDPDTEQEIRTLVGVDVKTQVMPPDRHAITWILARRYPDRWGQGTEPAPPIPDGSDRTTGTATDALAALQDMQRRAKQVRAALPPGVVDARPPDDRRLIDVTPKDPDA